VICNWSLLVRVYDAGVIGETKPLGLGDLGVLKSSVVSPDERDSEWTMCSAKCEPKNVETGRSFKAGNSETLAGALCG